MENQTEKDTLDNKLSKIEEQYRVLKKYRDKIRNELRTFDEIAEDIDKKLKKSAIDLSIAENKVKKILGDKYEKKYH